MCWRRPAALKRLCGSRLVDSTVAFAVMELDNLWAGIARSLFLSAAFCARDGTGNRLNLSKVARARSTDEALTYAIRNYRGAEYKSGSDGPWEWSDEPQWWKPRELLRALDAIGSSNYQQVTNAIDASSGVFPHLHSFRNFYAHRNKRTRSEVVKAIERLQFPRTYTATRALTSPVKERNTVKEAETACARSR